MSAATSVAALLGMLLVTAPTLAAPAVPTVVLFPRAVNSSDDGTALADVRKSLRRDGTLDVLTFDPAGGAFTRAAADARRPDWLTSSLSDSDRAALCRAVGAQFYAVVGRGDKGRADVRLSEAASSARAWTVSGQKSGDAAHQIEQLSADALAHPQAAVAAAPPQPRVSVPVTRPAPPDTGANTRTDKPIAAAPPVIRPAPVAASVLPNVVPPAPTVTVTPPGQAVSSIPAPTPEVVPVPRPTPSVPASSPLASLPAAHPAETVQGSAAAPPIVSAPPTVSAPPRPASPQTLPAASLPNVVPPAPPASSPAATVFVPSRDTVPALPPRSTARDLTPSAEDARAALDAMSRGDDALARSDSDGAIASYRTAINATPLASLPRLKLARVYLKADMKDRALDEGRRALLLAPDNADVQQLLSDIDAQTGTSDGAVARAAALLSQKPDDIDAHLTLGDALWNNGQTAQAEDEYKQAFTLSPAHSAAAQNARAHLARLYAAQSRYTECLAALRNAGRAGYALALSIVQGRADLLAATLETAQTSFDTGKSTHEAFYKTVTDAASQSQALSDFVAKATPPPSFALSHAHRILATQLLAQQAAVLVTYAETGSGTQAERASQLEKASQTEMLTAHAAETKLGLWNGSVSANN